MSHPISHQATRVVLERVMVGALLFLMTTTGVPANARGFGNGVRLLSADEDGIVVDVEASAYTLAEVGCDVASTCMRIAAPEFNLGGEPGCPDLPGRSILLSAPPGARLVMTSEVTAQETLYLDRPLVPAPTLEIDARPDGTAGGAGTETPVREVLQRDPERYAACTSAPGSPVVLEDAGYVRDMHLSRLTVYPFQYTPATGKLQHIRHLRVRVLFADRPAALAAPTRPDAGQFVDLVRQAVINPDQVQLWRAEPPSQAAPMALPSDRVRYRITVREPGLYQLTHTSLSAAGIALSNLNPRHLQVYDGSAELAVEVTGQEDGRFDSGDRVRFYAERAHSLYTDLNVYWLVVGDSDGRRMTTRAIAPQGSAPTTEFLASERFEQDRVYRSNMPKATDVDHWYWGQTSVLSRNSVFSLTVPFTLENPSALGSAALQVELWGESSDPRVNPDHHSRVYLNRVPIGDVSWSGAVSHTATLSLEATLLADGANTLTLFAPGDAGARDMSNQPWEVTWLNHFALSFSRSLAASRDRLRFSSAAGSGEYRVSGFSVRELLLYDVSEPASTVVLTGAQVGSDMSGYSVRFHDAPVAGISYYVTSESAVLAPSVISAVQPSGLRTPAQGADYLIIAHRNFLSGILPVADLRRSQGLRVRVIDVQDLYDEFSGGLLDPHAIREFIRYAYFNWPAPAPSFVLLVGDGTYDFFGNEGYGTRTFIPPYLANVDPTLGETAADNRYVTVAGDDVMPDLHLGRLPVNSENELAAMVDKIVSSETAPAPGAWRTRAVFVADDPDGAGAFDLLADGAASHLPAFFSIQRIYLGSAQYPLGMAVRAQQATVDAYSQGALFYNYTGHGSMGTWAAEQLFGLSNLPQVRNTSMYPIVLPMTCLEGVFHSPKLASLAESEVRLAGRGALASWSPTGLGVAEGHDYLHQGFYEAVFEHSIRVLGPATTAGKLNLFANSSYPGGQPRYDDLLDTYVLLGDPGTRIALPGDAYEPDGSTAQAHRTNVPFRSELHSWEPPADEDWSVFRAEAGVTYILRATSLGSGANTVLTLWDSAGRLLVQSAGVPSASGTSMIIWKAPELGNYYSRVTSSSSSPEFGYSFEILVATIGHLPFVLANGQ